MASSFNTEFLYFEKGQVIASNGTNVRNGDAASEEARLGSHLGFVCSSVARQTFNCWTYGDYFNFVAIKSFGDSHRAGFFAVTTGAGD